MHVINIKSNPCISCSAKTPYCKIDGCELYHGFIKEPNSKNEEITEEEYKRLLKEAEEIYKMCERR